MLFCALVSNYSLHFYAIQKHILPKGEGGFFGYADLQKCLIAYHLGTTQMTFTVEEFYLYYCFSKNNQFARRTVEKHLKRLQKYELIDCTEETVNSNLVRKNWFITPLMIQLFNEFEKHLINKAIQFKSGKIEMPPKRKINDKKIPKKYRKE